MGFKYKRNSTTPPPLERRRRRWGIINEVLPDDILVQILCCLPCQSAVKCKLVCKRWLSLISTPIFISCSISRQIQQQHDDEKYPIWKFIAHGKYLFLTSQLFKSDFSFSFLPCNRSSFFNPEFKILASSDDVCLCCTESSIRTLYFICNPSTKEWFELPRPPLSTLLIHHYVFGFTHKPYYSVQDHRVLLNSSSRFSVVRLKTTVGDRWSIEPNYSFELEVDIFSSETWQWTTCMMQHSSRPLITPWSCISRNGLLYWLCGYPRGQVIIHDPYNNKVFYVVELQPPDLFGPSWYKFSVSQGSLLAFDTDPYSDAVRVWELEEEDCDGHQPKWRFVPRSGDMGFSVAGAVAIHPNDRNIIYIRYSSRDIHTLSLRTGKFKRRYVQEHVTEVDHRACEVFEAAVDEMVVFKAPCWPTPVSALLNQRGYLHPANRIGYC